jgi:hypothetical protein
MKLIAKILLIPAMVVVGAFNLILCIILTPVLWFANNHKVNVYTGLKNENT